MLHHTCEKLLQNLNKYFQLIQINHSPMRKFTKSGDKLNFLEIIVTIQQQFLSSGVEHYT